MKIGKSYLDKEKSVFIYRCGFCNNLYSVKDEADECYNQDEFVFNSIHPIPNNTKVSLELFEGVPILWQHPSGAGHVVKSRGEKNDLKYLIECENETREWYDWEKVVYYHEPKPKEKGLRPAADFE